MATVMSPDDPRNSRSVIMDHTQPGTRRFRMLIDLRHGEHNHIDQQIDEIVHRSARDYEENLRENLRAKVRHTIDAHRGTRGPLELEFKIKQNMRTHRHETHPIRREPPERLQDRYPHQGNSTQFAEYARALRSPPDNPWDC